MLPGPSLIIDFHNVIAEGEIATFDKVISEFRSGIRFHPQRLFLRALCDPAHFELVKMSLSEDKVFGGTIPCTAFIESGLPLYHHDTMAKDDPVHLLVRNRSARPRLFSAILVFKPVDLVSVSSPNHFKKGTDANG